MTATYSVSDRSRKQFLDKQLKMCRNFTGSIPPFQRQQLSCLACVVTRRRGKNCYFQHFRSKYPYTYRHLWHKKHHIGRPKWYTRYLNVGKFNLVSRPLILTICRYFCLLLRLKRQRYEHMNNFPLNSVIFWKILRLLKTYWLFSAHLRFFQIYLRLCKAFI